MRLFGKVDGSVDRYDRAQWMTPPFDKNLATILAPTVIGMTAGAYGTSATAGARGTTATAGAYGTSVTRAVRQ